MEPGLKDSVLPSPDLLSQWDGNVKNGSHWPRTAYEPGLGLGSEMSGCTQCSKPQ